MVDKSTYKEKSHKFHDRGLSANPFYTPFPGQCNLGTEVLVLALPVTCVLGFVI